jgi:DNA-binding LytR/AlgR family response regulator
MSKITCCIIDDEPIARSLLRSYIEKDERLQLVAECSSIAQLMEVSRKDAPDLLFLDIHMPQISGLEYIRSLQRAPAVIFTTAYREFALDAFNLDAVDYLAKPFSFERFLQSIHKAVVYLGSVPSISGQDFIYVKSEGKLTRIILEEILFVEALREYVKVVLISGPPVVTYLSMTAMLASLPHSHFRRVHRSFIVNLRHIRTMDGNLLTVGDRTVPVSRSEKEGVLEIINKYKLTK